MRCIIPAVVLVACTAVGTASAKQEESVELSARMEILFAGEPTGVVLLSDQRTGRLTKLVPKERLSSRN